MSPRRLLLRRWWKRNFWPVMQLAALVVSVALSAFILREYTQTSAAQAAQARAERVAQVKQCFDSNAQGPASRRFLLTLRVILQNQIVGVQTRIVNEGPSPELERVVTRANNALADVDDFEARVESTTPTRRECRALAVKLGVELP